MRFHVLTIFPGMFSSPLAESIIARALERGLVEVELHDLRERTHDKRRTVDDYPFGGGPGMVMKPEPLFEAVEALGASGPASGPEGDVVPVVLLTPQGRTFTQEVAEGFAKRPEMVLICGRYEGVDERVRRHLVTDEISIGDYVLSGGELAAMVLIDAVARLIPGVVGSAESTQGGSFTTGLLQHPQYTRPAEFRGWAVPDVLMSGNHAEIALWRRQESLRRTFHRRPDLLESADLSPDERRFVKDLRRE
jgi:tRNA (guanine37-N1)-methyltransferase